MNDSRPTVLILPSGCEITGVLKMLGEPPEDWTLAAAGYPPGCVEFRRIIDYVPWWRR